MIEIKDLHKSFGKVKVLSNLDLSIRKGGIFAVLGPNGSGKTTLIKSILGMVVPDKGSIRIDGQEVLNKFEYRNEIDYLPQIARFPGNLSVKELIKMINELRSKPSKSDELVKAFGLVKALDQKLGHLSGGTKQKVNLVLTFMFDSPLVILDEPTTGLDPISLIYLKDLIRQEKNNGKTILITSHIMSFVEEVSDEIVFLLDGKIYFKGSVANLKKETGQKDLEHAIATIIVDEHI
jgi:Cu-processing system ATP-binding protein